MARSSKESLEFWRALGLSDELGDRERKEVSFSFEFIGRRLFGFPKLLFDLWGSAGDSGLPPDALDVRLNRGLRRGIEWAMRPRSGDCCCVGLQGALVAWAPLPIGMVNNEPAN